jgi:hypothetical protein
VDDNEPANNEPSIGPVQEKDTNAKVRDMKNIPTTPPFSDFFSDPDIKLLGITISKYPKKEIANNINTIKNVIFTYTFVEIVFKILGFKLSNK